MRPRPPRRARTQHGALVLLVLVAALSGLAGSSGWAVGPAGHGGGFIHPLPAIHILPDNAGVGVHTTKGCSAVTTCTTTAISVVAYSSVLVWVMATGATAPSGVSDSGSHSYSNKASSSTSTAPARYTAVYLTDNVSASSLTVTVTFAASTTYVIDVADITLTPVSSFDVATGSQFGTSTSATASLTTGANNELVLAGVFTNAVSTICAANGGTIIDDGYGGGTSEGDDEYLFVATAGSTTLGFSFHTSTCGSGGSSTPWAETEIAIKSAKVPSAPTSFVHGTVTATSIPTTWVDGAGPVVNETGFKTLYSGGACGTYSFVVSTGGRTDAYTFSGLTQSTAYCLEVESWNATGASAFATMTNVVTASYTATFTTSPVTPDVGVLTTFTSTVTGGTSPYTYSWVFGDGGTSTLQNPRHTYASAAAFTVYLNVTDHVGAIAHDVQTENVHADPTDSFTVSPTSPDAGTSATFTSTVNAGTTPYTYAWAFGDGGTSTAQNPTHTYSSAGTYVAYLNVTDTDSVVATYHANVVVNAAPTDSWTASPVTATINRPTTFTSIVNGGASPYTYTWVAEPTIGQFSTAANPTYTFALSGTFTVYLNVTDADSVVAAYSHSYVVKPAPTDSFTVNPPVPDSTSPVTFTSSVSNGVSPYTYAWAFGDGGTSAFVNPAHTYATPGTVTAYLNVTDSNGAVATYSKVITIDPFPTDSFSVAPNPPEMGHVATFTSSVTGGVSPFTYAWIFGDGGTSTAQNPSHTYASAGTYTVTLNAQDADGNTATFQLNVPVLPLVVVVFTSTPGSPDAGRSVSFASSVSGGSSPYTYAWTFGDGGTSATAGPTHVYTLAGNYTVYLTVIDSVPVSSTAEAVVTVNPVPVATISVGFLPAHASTPLQFLSTVRGGASPYTYNWSFGDGGLSSIATPIHSYAVAGNYSVSLTVKDADAVVALASLSVAVLTPVASGLQYVSLLTGSVAIAGTDVYQFEIFVVGEPAGTSLNLAQTTQAWQTLTISVFGKLSGPLVNWSVLSSSVGGFSLQITFTAAQVSSILADVTEVNLNASVTVSGQVLPAVGFLKAATLERATVPGAWWSVWFGIPTPPPDPSFSSVSGIIGDLAWWGDSNAGRATYAALVLIAVATYLWEGHKWARQRIAGQPKGQTGGAV